MFANPNCFCLSCALAIFSHQLFIKEIVICFRQQCYKCVLDSLQHLLVMKTSPSQSPGRPTWPGPPPTPDPNTLTPLDADKLVSFKLNFLSVPSPKPFSLHWLPYISFNVNSNNLFNVTGDKYGFLIVLIGLLFVQIMTKVIFFYIFHTNYKEQFYNNNIINQRQKLSVSVLRMEIYFVFFVRFMCNVCFRDWILFACVTRWKKCCHIHCLMEMNCGMLCCISG